MIERDVVEIWNLDGAPKRSRRERRRLDEVANADCMPPISIEVAERLSG